MDKNYTEEDENIVENDELLEKGDKKSNKKKLIITGVVIISFLIAIACILIVLLTSSKGKDEEWEDSFKKASAFVKKMNLTERVNLLFGTENMKAQSILVKNESEKRFLCVGKIDPFHNSQIDFKGMCLQDGPAGVRFANGSGISWQAGINTAATFNKELMRAVGKEMGGESREKGINALLGPCANLMRSPQGGRIWEAFGDDPFFAGVCASEMVKGIQSSGVIATMKHFLGNDQETYRKASSSNIDKKTIMDIYAEPFFRAIKEAGLASVMSAYNAVNNKYCDESTYILTDILRGKLGFKGFVTSDWWGVYSNHSNSINSGLDMNMPGGYYPNPSDEAHKYDNYGRNHSFWSRLEEMIKQGKVNASRIEEATKRIIASMYEMKQMTGFPSIDLFKETKTEDRKKLQRKAATESQVLLKNEDNFLPLNGKNISKIAIIGNDAFPQDCIGAGDCQCVNETNRVFNGHIPLGYGSGTTTFGYLVTPIEALRKAAENNGITLIESGKLIYHDEIIKNKTVHMNATEDLEGAVKAAEEADLSIVFIKSISGEEYLVVENSIGDRADLNVLHNGNELVEKVANASKGNIVVVINSPGPVNVPWLEKVKAVIYSGYPGAESGNAISDILFGVESPSGRLPFVWGKAEDYPFILTHLNNLTVINQTTGKTWKDEYRYDGIDSAGLPDGRPGHGKEQYIYTEGLYIGQRWFNKNGLQPIFPFGHGLSYTKFEYTSLELSMSKEGLTASFKIKNIGSKEGFSVPMMFLTFPDSIGEYPKHIFKGFEKVKLKPNETKSVKITADSHALSYFNESEDNYKRVDNGKIIVAIAENGDPKQVKLSKEIDAKY